MSLTLQTERLILRPPAPRDWPAFEAFMMSERSAWNGSKQDKGQAWRVFAAELGHWQIHGHGMWAVTRKDDDTALALIGPWCPADWPENEVGWMVLDDAVEGTGVAFEAARAAVDHAYRDLKWDTVVSYIDDANVRSIALAERLGAVVDPNAPQPRQETTCLVYRHPKPGAAA